MFDFQQTSEYWARTILKVLLALGLLFLLPIVAVALSGGAMVLAPIGLLLNVAAVLLAEEIAAWFVHAFYGLQTRAQARGFLWRQLFGQCDAHPYLVVKDGEIATGGDDVVQKIGGPALLIVYNDSAVVLEQAARLTRVARGPQMLSLESYERVWNTLDLRSQRWVFPVNAMTVEGIPVTYEADIQFQIGDTDEDIFKAATSTWVKEADCSEPDRLRTWTKRVIIGFAEGALRSILSRYELDQLIKAEVREEVRHELETRLVRSAPQVGARILKVTLQDLKLEDKLVEQWVEVWKAERSCAIEEVLVKAQRERAAALEKARGKVRKDILERTLKVFQEMASKDGRLPARSLILSCLGAVQQTACKNNGLFFPSDVLQTLEVMERRIADCEGCDDETPSAERQ